jgi:hypothetical protein
MWESRHNQIIPKRQQIHVYNFVYTLHAKKFRIKKPNVEIKSWDLINYWAFCCQIHLGTAVFVLIMDECFIKLEIEQ